MSDVVVTSLNSSSDHDDEGVDIAHFSLALYPGDDDPTEIDMVVCVLEEPSERPASNALLTGLAIMALERQGFVAKAIEKMFPNGRPSEIVATDHIRLMLVDEANSLPA